METVSTPEQVFPTTSKKIEEALKQVEVKDRRYHLQTYKECFVGKEAVDLLVSGGHANSRKEAVLIGRRLAKDFKLFVHVTADHEFEDAYFFYRFNSAEKRSDSLHATSLPQKDFSDGSGDTNRRQNEPIQLCDVDIETRRGLIRTFLAIEVKDRRYRLRTYKECFVGREAVNLLVSSGYASSREQAVQIGRSLAENYQLFEHVLHRHLFKDAYLFFKFKKDACDRVINDPTLSPPLLGTVPACDSGTYSSISSLSHSDDDSSFTSGGASESHMKETGSNIVPSEHTGELSIRDGMDDFNNNFGGGGSTTKINTHHTKVDETDSLRREEGIEKEHRAAASSKELESNKDLECLRKAIHRVEHEKATIEENMLNKLIALHQEKVAMEAGLGTELEKKESRIKELQAALRGRVSFGSPTLQEETRSESEEIIYPSFHRSSELQCIIGTLKRLQASTNDLHSFSELERIQKDVISMAKNADDAVRNFACKVLE